MDNILQSPCTNNCFVPPGTEICIGCFRSIKEIIDWINLTDYERNEVLKKIEQRKKEHGKTE